MSGTATQDAGGWLILSPAGARPVPEEPPRWWRLIGGVALVALLVFASVAAASALTARRAAEREAVNDALQITDVLAQSVVQPQLEAGITAVDPAVAAAARARLDSVVRSQLLSRTLVRVKLWDADGRIVYSDEPRLVGERFGLDEEERKALRKPTIEAEVTDLDAPENRFERAAATKLLEVYRPVWTSSGQVLLFETYSRYDAVTARSGQLTRAFGGIILTSLLLFLLAQAPLTWALVSRVRRAQAEREAWLARAVSASDAERRRIAATLHDGAVQELAASAFLVAGSADRARSEGHTDLAGRLDLAASSVRSSIGGLRSLLVDIYPPSLRTAGLAAAVNDLVAPLRSRGVRVTVDIPDDAALDPQVEAVLYRVAQETLRNVARHADASSVVVALTMDPLVLEVHDDGVGFDAPAVLRQPECGHFGLRLTADQAATLGAALRLRSAPGEGTRWRLEIPR
jgi:signal transduction histidine kinase